MENTYVLQMYGIEKEYSGNRVLKGVDLEVRPGEIVSIVGENGAGKSTLMNILFGMPVIHNTGGFKGTIKIDGEEVNISTPEKAIELGIGMVHQEFMLIPSFNVKENIKINRELTKSNLVSKLFSKKLESLDDIQMHSDARTAMDKMGMSDIDTKTMVDGMSVGHMQFIECAREIDKKNIRLIVFDEPTAVLTETESQQLLDAIRSIAASGVGIIFISHKLDEVLSISDHIMVMRDGEHVATLKKEDTNPIQLAELMVGRSIDASEISKSRDFSEAPNIMSIRNLRVLMPGELVKGIDLDIKEGEILGIAGLAGHGKIGIANGVMGVYETEGSITFKGEALPLNAPYAVMKKRINFVTEDRKNVGLILESSIERNIVTPALRVHKNYLKHYGFFTQLDKQAMRAQAEKMIDELHIKCTSPTQRVSALSGGNQQKVCIAAALTLAPELLFVSEPTRGIDIGAKKVILDYLRALNQEKKMTIVITSSELRELRSICDRIVIISGGRLMGELRPDDSDTDYGLLMSGVQTTRT